MVAASSPSSRWVAESFLIMNIGRQLDDVCNFIEFARRSRNVPSSPEQLYKERTDEREIAAITLACLAEGYTGFRLKREVVKRYRKKFGIGFFEVLSIVSFIVNIVKLVITWRNNR